MTNRRNHPTSFCDVRHDAADSCNGCSRIEESVKQPSDGRNDTHFCLGCYLTVSRSVLPAVKEGVFQAAMAILSPVRGFRRWLAGRYLVEKVPNPAILMGLPLARISAMVENTALTAASIPRMWTPLFPYYPSPSALKHLVHHPRHTEH